MLDKSKPYNLADYKRKMRREALKSKYIENPYLKQVDGEWLILGKFSKAEQVDAYFRKLVDDYIHKKSNTYTFRSVCEQVAKDGVYIQKTSLRRLFNRVGINFRKPPRIKKTNTFVFTFDDDVKEFLMYLGDDAKPFVRELIKLAGNLPTETMLLLIPGGKRAMIRKDHLGKMQLWLLTDFTATELSIIQRVAKKGYKYHETELIKAEFSSYPGWHVIGGSLNPDFEMLPKDTKGEKIEIKIQWPTANDLLEQDGTTPQ
jgi:transposase